MWSLSGPHDGHLEVRDFHRVVGLIEGFGLEQRPDSPEMKPWDPRVRLEWSRGTSEPRLLETHAETGPPEILATALAMEAVGRRVEWTRTDERRSWDIPADLPERYAFLFSRDDDDFERTLKSLPYERIELDDQKTRIVLLASGRAEWTGNEKSPRVGSWSSGYRDPHGYAELCLFVERLRLERLAGAYKMPGICCPCTTTTVTLVRRDGTFVEFSDYGSHAPIEVRALIEMVWTRANRATWKQR